MTQQVEKLAVLFADISGSTALYENRGDEVARRLIAQCIGVMMREVQAHKGALIKTIGDEIMCVFPTAEDAFLSACAMQKAVEKERFEGDCFMHIRVGFHYGDVIREADDVFGDTVNVAARVTAITRARQILTTRAAVDAMTPASREKTRQIMRAEFKGKQQQFDISLVIWEMDDMMSTRIGIPAYRKTPDNIDELLLRYHDQVLKVNKERRSVILGRGDTCDLIVMNNFASRQHLKIELRFGKFVAVDQSTNGSYVRFADGHVARIAHEEIHLLGTGTISMGQPYSGDESELIGFAVNTQHGLGKSTD
jgi:hypothetical protein